MKYLIAVLLCLALVAPAFAAHPAPDNLIVCETEASLTELLLGVINTDLKQVNYILDSKACFELKPGIPISYAGTVAGSLFKIRAYAEGESVILYTSDYLLNLMNDMNKKGEN